MALTGFRREQYNGDMQTRISHKRRAFKGTRPGNRVVHEAGDVWARAPGTENGQGADSGLGNVSNDVLQHSVDPACGRQGARLHGGCPPFYKSEAEHLRTVGAARLICGVSSTAASILDVLAFFCVHTGYIFGVKSRKRGKNAALVAKAEKVLERWQRDVKWDTWVPEGFRRQRRDGECILALEPSEETRDLPDLRVIEPDQMRQPYKLDSVYGELGLSGRDASWRYGVLTSTRNTAKPIAYWIVDYDASGNAEGSLYYPHEIFHSKTEWMERQAKRGVSDFFSTANSIARVTKLLRSLVLGAGVQANIAYVAEHPEGGGVTGPAGVDVNPTHKTPTGESSPSFQYGEPRRLDVKAGFKYHPGPMAGSGQHETLIAVLQAGLRGIGTRWQFPEGTISGDQSNNVLASALVAEGPFTRCMTSRQWYYGRECVGLLERVLDFAGTIGQLGAARENVLDDIEVTVEAPAVVSRRLLEETERNAVLSEHHQLSARTWAVREDLDRDEEKENMETDPTQPTMDVVGAPASQPDSERVS